MLAESGGHPILQPEDTVLQFGEFRLLCANRLLLRRSEPVRLGGRAFDLLTVLARRSGSVVSHAEIYRSVWPKTVVEENSIRVQVRSLRRALGDSEGRRYISNVPGRGYCFVAPVISEAAVSSTRNTGAIPRRLASLVGRDDDVGMLAGLVSARRLVTLVGPAGIGKSALAQAVAERLSPVFEHGCRFVALTPVLRGVEEDVFREILNSIQEKRLLLVLDNCDPLADAVTGFVERLLQNAPHVHLLVTSREPLRIDVEQAHRVASLPIPSAVSLFVERAMAADQQFRLSDASVPLVAQLCRRLDGVPLAIEVASLWVGEFGLRGLLAGFDANILNLCQRRSTLPRHRTLQSAMDASYELLSEEQRVILQCLAGFVGPFSLDEALAAVGMAGFRQPADVHTALDGLISLVDKSLVMAEPVGKTVKYRLLEVTRIYLMKLPPRRLDGVSATEAYPARLRRTNPSRRCSNRPALPMPVVLSLTDRRDGRRMVRPNQRPGPPDVVPPRTE